MGCQFSSIRGRQAGDESQCGKDARIAAFSDEMRDGLRGGWDDDTKGAFLVGEPGHEMSIKFGIVGAIEHPQV